jgi:galactokinase
VATTAAATRRFLAPGRVNLIGEHTDYSGGLVLPAALDLGVTVTAVAAERIRLRSDAEGVPVDVAGDGSGEPAAGWGRYVAAVAAQLAVLGRPAIGIDGTIASTVPPGAGLSSSAALEVAVATALCAVAGFHLEALELAAACRNAEEQAVGVPCGILDQAASVLGEPGHAILLDCGSLAHEAVPVPDGLRLLVVDSGERHAHESSGYAERRSELEAGLAALGWPAPSQLGVDDLAPLNGVPLRRVRHVVTENARVREAVAALRAGDEERLGALFRASHESMRDDYEITTPALDELVDLAYAAGAVAARMTGGGFGGSIVALVHADLAERIAAEVVAGFTHGTAVARLCAASAGAREL